MSSNPGARTSRQRRLAGGRLLTPVRAIVVAVVLGGGVLLYLAVPGTVVPPTYQVSLEMPGMSPHLLNVWVSPDPLTAGDAEITAQVVDRGGNPVMAQAIAFKLGGPEGDVVFEGDGLPVPRTNRTDAGRFRAVAPVPSSGKWWLELGVEMAGRNATARLPINVER